MLTQHPLIAAAAVVGLRHPRWGEQARPSPCDGGPRCVYRGEHTGLSGFTQGSCVMATWRVPPACDGGPGYHKVVPGEGRGSRCMGSQVQGPAAVWACLLWPRCCTSSPPDMPVLGSQPG